MTGRLMKRVVKFIDCGLVILEIGAAEAKDLLEFTTFKQVNAFGASDRLRHQEARHGK
jgi:hypothetical protein